MMTQVTFTKDGYDPFIDFLKAYAIICVLIGHTIPNSDLWGYVFWAGMQVPLFILIQVFHYYKKETKLDIGKILKRIIVPFAIVTGFVFLIKLIFEGVGLKLLIISLIKDGGYGPGSYYPLVYIQIALLLVLFKPLFYKYNKLTLFWLFFIISEACEIACSLLNVPEFLYRLLVVRYVFLLYLGWLWVKEGIRLNWWTIVLCILSFLTIIYFQYLSKTVDNEPWFFNTAWRSHRWPCYFYVSHGLVLILFIVWQKIQIKGRIRTFVKKMASASYEIFLVQMAVIALFSVKRLMFVDNNYVRFALWFIIVWCVSLLGGIYFQKVCKRIIK